MDLFIPANAVYTTYFGTSPPSRATVAVPLLSGERVRLEVVGFDDRNSDEQGRLVGGRQALHVQGLSYWAPANIGPYSQAVLVSQ
jgi:diphthine-ammonia ligase